MEGGKIFGKMQSTIRHKRVDGFQIFMMCATQ